MSSSAAIGIVGGCGAIGRAVAVRLQARGLSPLRIGGRQLDAMRALVDEIASGQAEPVKVDVEDPTSLAAFCEGCRIVVNCAGPSYRILDRVATAALAAGADYVDPAGDEPVYERLEGLDLAAQGRRVLLSAGMMPGLSGLLPRWLVRQGFRRGARLSAYVGGRGRLTPAAAADYLVSLGSGLGEPLAGWRDGVRRSRALEPLRDTTLPFFPGLVTAYPYLSAEVERLARALALDEVRWYNVFDGQHVLGALGRLQGAMSQPLDASAALELVRAAELDLFGREPYYQFVLRLEGETAHAPLSRTLIARASNASQFTGASTTLAVVAALEEQVPLGLAFAAEALDPDLMVEQLRGDPVLTMFELVEEMGTSESERVEEGIV